MALRTSLKSIIKEVRFLLGGTIEEELNDLDIQAALDRHRREHNQTGLESVYQLNISGQRTYKVWKMPSYLDTDVVFQDSTYATVASPTGDLLDLINGRVEFASSRANSTLYLTGWEYDIYSSAAQLLDIRAMSLADEVDTFSGAPGSFSRKSSRRKTMIELADRYREQAKGGSEFSLFQVVELVRNDHC